MFIPQLCLAKAHTAATFGQPGFEPRNVPTRPMTAEMIHPMGIQTALSVGDPVKNLETSELNEFVALIPMTISATPPTSRATETILSITDLQMRELIIFPVDSRSSFASLTRFFARR